MGFFRFVHTCICKYVHQSDRDNEDKLNSHFSKFAIYMLFKERDIEESDDLQIDMSSLDNDISRMQFESLNSEE